MTLYGCGARDGLRGPGDAATDTAVAEPEGCDGFDNDRDHRVDEIFRDDAGLYVNDEHCGACGIACPDTLPLATHVACVAGTAGPRCQATRCEANAALTRDGRCAPLGQHLCMECIDDSSCGPLLSARCATVAGLRHCVVDCDESCPATFVCGVDDDGNPACLPPTGACVCTPKAGDFELACATTMGDRCPGRRACVDGELSECLAPAEQCDLQDNDCDDAIDEDFVDARGVYSVDDKNCGQCGRDCTIDATTLKLTCGGDPLSPSCVLDCPGLQDGLQPGDKVDADGNFDNGCECTVIAIDDPISETAGVATDENCDGADGVVVRSLYVATDGDDDNIGSPSAPLRTITKALSKAQETADPPRDTILVAAGTYAEAIELFEGVRIFGGYRRDFLERDTKKHQVRVIAPPNSMRHFGAVVVGAALGSSKATRLSGLWLEGRDGSDPGAPSTGVVLTSPGRDLQLDDLTLVSGRPSPATMGVAGASGTAPTQAAGKGGAPRGALEDDAHVCVDSSSNVVVGGAGGQNICGSLSVSGGRGGDGDCPHYYDRALSGMAGQAGGGASGGLGGYHIIGPIFGGTGCSQDVCCGLADFTVPPGYEQAQTGDSGSDGSSGAAGSGCSDSLGSFAGSAFAAGQASAGGAGKPGAGGGGGGAGGGAEITYVDGDCPYADGLGGGGGGGGAGGCGGAGGAAGQSAGPAVALLLLEAKALPTMQAITFVSADGARGGDGGDGGDGGKGGAGAAGGSLNLELRSNPTLSGASPGERGGNGGNGGGGGGGGGGCGGASVGLWISGMTEDAALRDQLMASHTFTLGEGGQGGLGGGGNVAGAAGSAGTSEQVVFR